MSVYVDFWKDAEFKIKEDKPVRELETDFLKSKKYKGRKIIGIFEYHPKKLNYNLQIADLTTKPYKGGNYLILTDKYDFTGNKRRQFSYIQQYVKASNEIAKIPDVAIERYGYRTGTSIVARKSLPEPVGLTEQLTKMVNADYEKKNARKANVSSAPKATTSVATPLVTEDPKTYFGITDQEINPPGNSKSFVEKFHTYISDEPESLEDIVKYTKQYFGESENFKGFQDLHNKIQIRFFKEFGVYYGAFIKLLTTVYDVVGGNVEKQYLDKLPLDYLIDKEKIEDYVLSKINLAQAAGESLADRVKVFLSVNKRLDKQDTVDQAKTFFQFVDDNNKAEFITNFKAEFGKIIDDTDIDKQLVHAYRLTYSVIKNEEFKNYNDFANKIKIVFKNKFNQFQFDQAKSIMEEVEKALGIGSEESGCKQFLPLDILLEAEGVYEDGCLSYCQTLLRLLSFDHEPSDNVFQDLESELRKQRSETETSTTVEGETSSVEDNSLAAAEAAAEKAAADQAAADKAAAAEKAAADKAAAEKAAADQAAAEKAADEHAKRKAADEEAKRQAEIEAEQKRQAEIEAEQKRQAEIEAEQMRQADIEAEQKRQAEIEAEQRRQVEIEAERLRLETERQAAADAGVLLTEEEIKDLKIKFTDLQSFKEYLEKDEDIDPKISNFIDSKSFVKTYKTVDDFKNFLELMNKKIAEEYNKQITKETPTQAENEADNRLKPKENENTFLKNLGRTLTSKNIGFNKKREVYRPPMTGNENESKINSQPVEQEVLTFTHNNILKPNTQKKQLQRVPTNKTQKIIFNSKSMSDINTAQNKAKAEAAERIKQEAEEADRLKKEAEEAERIKQQAEADRVKKEEADRVKREAEADRAKRETERAKQETARQTEITENSQNGYYKSQIKPFYGNISINNILQEEKIYQVDPPSDSKFLYKHDKTPPKKDEDLTMNVYAHWTLKDYCKYLSKRCSSDDGKHLSFFGVRSVLSDLGYNVRNLDLSEKDYEVYLQKRNCLGIILDLNAGHDAVVSKHYKTCEFAYMDSLPNSEPQCFGTLNEVLEFLKTKMINKALYVGYVENESYESVASIKLRGKMKETPQIDDAEETLELERVYAEKIAKAAAEVEKKRLEEERQREKEEEDKRLAEEAEKNRMAEEAAAAEKKKLEEAAAEKKRIADAKAADEKREKDEAFQKKKAEYERKHALENEAIKQQEEAAKAQKAVKEQQEALKKQQEAQAVEDPNSPLTKDQFENLSAALQNNIPNFKLLLSYITTDDSDLKILGKTKERGGVYKFLNSVFTDPKDNTNTIIFNKLKNKLELINYDKNTKRDDTSRINEITKKIETKPGAGIKEILQAIKAYPLPTKKGGKRKTRKKRKKSLRHKTRNAINRL